MISKAIFQSINLFCKIGYALGAFPFKWDAKKKELKLTRSKIKLVQWYAVIIYMISNSIFMFSRIIQAACCMKISYGVLFMNLFNVVTWITSTAFEINSLIFRKEIPDFVNISSWRPKTYFEVIVHSSILS